MNIFILPDGRAKLMNFTCAFHYIVGQPTGPSSLSSVISTPRQQSIYCDPAHYNEKDKNHIQLPTITGDVWSFGAVMLSVCISWFSSVFHTLMSALFMERCFQKISEAESWMLTPSKLLKGFLFVRPRNSPIWTTESRDLSAQCSRLNHFVVHQLL
jgi:hypothetical protein